MASNDRTLRRLHGEAPAEHETVTRLEGLLENARTLLDEAQHSVRDQRLLLKVGGELGASLDYETTLQRVARLVVADFADWCFVDLVDADGRVRDVAVAHRDQAKEELARALVRGLPQLPSAPHGVVRVLRTLQPELYTSTADEPPPLGHYLGGDFPDALRELGARSYICVPLCAREKALGAITYIRGHDSPGYDSRDLELAAELAQRSATAIDNAILYRKMSDAVRDRDDLMTILSHDLRSLLGTVRVNTDLLLKQESPSLEREAVERLDRAAARMKQLVDDILDVSRLESGGLTLERHDRDVETLVADALDAVRASAKAKEIELVSHVASGLRVFCDPTRVFQVLLNLLDNAIKFTPKGGRIAVQASAQDTEAVVSVADSGVGIREADLPHVFDRFWQGRPQRAGAGLGLAIAKGIVEAHGGRISVDSRPDAGTTLYFTLPLSPSSKRGESAVDARGAQQGALDQVKAPAKVLVADDDDDFREGLRASLVANGYEVIEARDGAAALEVLARAADRRGPFPDVVVLDIRMPGCSGLGVLNAMGHLRRRPPTLLVTGFTDPSVHILAERLGAARVLFKPVEVEHVLTAVMEAAGRASARVSDRPSWR